MKLDDVAIVAAVRSPIGTYGGQFKTISAVQLGIPVMAEAIKRANIDPDLIGDIGWGCCYMRTKDEVNIGRVTAVKAGIPVTVPAFSIQRVCTSSMWAIASGMMGIRQGYYSIYMAGGVESMSTVPYTLDELRWGARMNNVELRDAMWDGVTRIGVGPPMGITAENLAEKYNISRGEQDELAYESHMKAVAAIKAGKFREEIVSIAMPGSKGKPPTMVDTDEHPRSDTTTDALSKLRPVFKEGGTVTAGNSSGINDAASAVVIMQVQGR